MTSKHWWQWLRRKSRLVPFVGWAILLLALGSLLIIFGPRLGWSVAPTVGGVLLGAALGLLSSTISSRLTAQEQYAKDANLKRKEDYYGPLHADLRALREHLQAARSGQKPYPLWIAGTHEVEPTGRHLSDEPHALARWTEFRSDYRTDNFTPEAHELLDGAIDYAARYNRAMDTARAPTVVALSPALTEALHATLSSTEFAQWRQRMGGEPPGSFANPTDRAHWFNRISLTNDQPPRVQPSLSQVLADGWVNGWGPNRPETVGWLLTGQPDQAAHCRCL